MRNALTACWLLLNATPCSAVPCCREAANVSLGDWKLAEPSFKPPAGPHLRNPVPCLRRARWRDGTTYRKIAARLYRRIALGRRQDHAKRGSHLRNRAGAE